MYTTAFTFIASLCVHLPLTSAATLQTRQYTSHTGKFYLETRQQDISSGDATYNYLSLIQTTDNQGHLLERAHLTWAGDGSLFHLHNGTLNTESAYTNSSGETATVQWKNTPVLGDHLLTFKPTSELANPRRVGSMNIELGTHAFLSPGGKYTESDWTFCLNEDGSDYGFAIGNVSVSGVTCDPIYAYVM